MTWPLKLLYVHSDTPNYVRVSKNIPVFSRLFEQVHYVGASRGRAWDRDFDAPNIHYHLWDRVLPHGARSARMLPDFVRYLHAQCAQIRPDVVVATNEDFVIPFVCGLIPRPRYLVCDLLDSIAHRIAGRARLLNPLWSLVSAFGKSRVDALVEVTEQRLARHRVTPLHTAVILNSPPTTGVLAPWPEAFGPSVFLSGSLNDGIMGVETLLKALESVPGVTAVAAGRLNGAWLNETFKRHPRVRFLGELTPRDSLRIAAACNAMFAFYKPINKTMLYAAPNKVFDAMMLARPLLMNEECKASDFAVAEGFGLRCAYCDAAALARLIRRVVSPDQELARKCAAARAVFQERYAWEHMEKRWSDLFKRLFAQP
jgi:glycosyltransferase involved in cell wall biosynthesis